LKEEPLNGINHSEYYINDNFLIKAEKFKLYEKFDKLSLADFFCAAVSYIEKIPLLTFDSDFDKAKEEIELIKI
jgi:predicted nucleic acid-binding protein